MRRIPSTALVVIWLIAAAHTALAQPKKGFHTGPYLALEVGILQADFDRDQAADEKVGRDFEPLFGFLFGWNFSDGLSAELQGLYATNINAGRREHIASANIYGKYTLVADTLTNFKNLSILPFAKAGMSIKAAILPGNRASDDSSVPSMGWGPTVGAGVAFLLYKYFYFGLDIQGDMLIFDDIRQTVGGTPNTLVYKGGFYPSFGAMAVVGVHY